ncbi:hypothetical protein ABH922_002490 [Rhodococcus sp. 27YEA15]|uniref:hypothetical protein n=1 Tax=Rhodococcus sp. 27YEA15 TaxID=3156259 RepID=UPI003C7EB362
MRESDPPTAFPSDSKFSGVPVVSSLAYEAAWSINASVADRFGQARLADLYRALATGPSTDAEVDRRTRAVLGVGIDDVRLGWIDWMNSHLG